MNKKISIILLSICVLQSTPLSCSDKKDFSRSNERKYEQELEESIKKHQYFKNVVYIFTATVSFIIFLCCLSLYQKSKKVPKKNKIIQSLEDSADGVTQAHLLQEVKRRNSVIIEDIPKESLNQDFIDDFDDDNKDNDIEEEEVEMVSESTPAISKLDDVQYSHISSMPMDLAIANNKKAKIGMIPLKENKNQREIRENEDVVFSFNFNVNRLRTNANDLKKAKERFLNNNNND